MGSLWVQSHGNIVRLEGLLPPDVEKLLADKGSFKREGAWWATKEQWPGIQRLLTVMGIAIAEGMAPELMHEARFEVSSLGEVIVYGPLPKEVPPEYLGAVRSKGYMGMTPLALPQALDLFRASKIQPVLTPSVQRLHEATQEMIQNVKRVKAADPMTLPGHTFEDGSTLMPHQRTALAMFDATDGRFLLADDMGLGKTVSGIAMARHAGAERVLIVCPANAVYVWDDHIRRLDASKPGIIQGREGSWSMGKGNRQWVVCSYALLAERMKDIQHRFNPDLVIADEFHMAKTPDAERTKALRLLTRTVPYCVGMTGTPMPNLVIDIWSQLDILWARRWGDRFQFGVAFAGGQKKHWGWDFSGKSNEKILSEYLEPIMLRRLKSEVGQHLPPKFRTPVRVDIVPAYRKQYDAELEKIASWKEELRDLRKRGKEDPALSGKILAKANKLRQISSLGRIGSTVERTMELVEAGKPVVIFTYFLDSLAGIKAALTAKKVKFAVIDGSTPAEQRGQIAKDFQAGKYQVFLGQIVAAGTAITLTKADRMIVHDIDLTPLNNVQAEDRINRLGASGDRTVHEYLIGKDTVDEKLLKVMMKRIANSKDILDLGKSMEQEIVDELTLDFFGGA